METLHPAKKIIYILAITAGLGGIGYLGYQNYQLTRAGLALEKELAEKKTELASTTKSLEDAKTILRQTEKEKKELVEKLLEEKNRIDTLTGQVKDVTHNVGTLIKLSKLDPELLKKYSKIYFLNENYVPPKLISINPIYAHDPKKEQLIHESVWPFLENLLETASSRAVDLRIISAYRSFREQAEVKSSYKIIYGSGANRFSADQGYSEHQLGTTVDFTTAKTGTNFSTFEKTEAYQWLTENAHRFGFVLSYPKGNAYYQSEPWHWRFVGKSLADELNSRQQHFYDLDQRVIDTYLISIFD